MSIFSRYFPLVLGVPLLAMSAGAMAQVTLNMTTAANANCVATTDASGLALVPGSTDLTATGVTLTGPGCGTGAADFEATLTVPSATPVGTAVNVSWSAGPDATQCTYGGTAGLTGWPVGGSACSGAACNGPHTIAVTPTAALTYNLSITCTNATGFKQGSLTANPIQTPPLPQGFALTAPATAQVGTAFPVSWSVSGAATCTGNASLGGSSANLGGWTDSTSAASPRNVTASQAGTYTLGLVCENGNGTATSQSATVVVSGGTTENCPTSPLTRLTTANIRYPNVSSSMVRNNVDVRLFENIWGHATNVDTTELWPGRNGAVPAITGWGKTQYVAAKFTVPANVSAGVYETLRYSTYYSGPELTMSVTAECGNFAPSNGNCLSTGVGTGDAFKKLVITPHTNGCPLVPGQTYYINMKMASPQPTDCNGGATCTLATTNILGAQ